MLSMIVLLGVGAVVWRLGQWPFDRSYRYLPRYDEVRARGPGGPRGPGAGEAKDATTRP
ncbi:protein of unknown function [Rhodovastum atsumiense]|uniref:hypothetical protein n=1 Tax=Rhodovastum atsumiense TaxID=504468 RepID=UPI00139F29AE|nr:hypothetical protein [Rhodovastum atsumiense]CAH2601968.1 protein of unknown function [Rhodovastum atsumiense]